MGYLAYHSVASVFSQRTKQPGCVSMGNVFRQEVPSTHTWAHTCIHTQTCTHASNSGSSASFAYRFIHKSWHKLVEPVGQAAVTLSVSFAATSDRIWKGQRVAESWVLLGICVGGFSGLQKKEWDYPLILHVPSFSNGKYRGISWSLNTSDIQVPFFYWTQRRWPREEDTLSAHGLVGHNNKISTFKVYSTFSISAILLWLKAISH